MKADIKDHLLRIRWRMLHLSRRQVYSRIYKAIRPASSPYISGDGFRRLGRQVFDETCQSLDPAKVKNGDVVFVSTDLAVRFFREIDPGIRASYRLITHNSDVAVDAALTRLVTDKVELWFAQNNSAEHDRVVPIPIGLENLHHYNAGVPGDFDSMRTYDGARKNRVLAAFTIGTNPGERNRAHEIASKAACVEQLGRRLPQKDYLRTLVTYRFLLSPPGNGLDTHRTWEAMYLGVVPVVKDSAAVRSFRRRGLPMWVVGSWDELLSVSEHDLEVKYEELKRGFESPALFMGYWRDLIRGTQRSQNPAGRTGREAHA